jgi:hypothetical protein
MNSMNGLAASGRRKRDAEDGGGTTTTTTTRMRRTTSNNSDMSDDILVAGPSQMTTMTTTTHGKTSDVDVRNDVGCISMRFNSPTAREKLKGILKRKPSPTTMKMKTATMKTSTMKTATMKTTTTTTTTTTPPQIPTPRRPKIEDDDYNDDYNDDGPNHRGTYSKAHVLRHPDIEFVHRGQGRYVKLADLRSDAPTSSPRPTR